MAASQEFPGLFGMLFISCSVVTFIACLAVFFFIAPRLSSRFIPSYNSLFDRNTKMDWNSTILSQCFAVIASCVTLFGFLAENGLYVDPIWGTVSVVHLEFGLVLGYMLADVLIKLLESSALYKTQYMFHHVSVALGVLACAKSGACAFFIFHRCLHELSNIFLNFVKFFNFLRLDKNSPLIVANGIVFTVVFFLCRFVIMPWYWLSCYHGFWGKSRQPPIYVTYAVVSIGILLDVLNVYWFYLIINGLKKLLKRKVDSSKEKHSWGLRKSTNVDHRIRNQQILLNSLGTTPSLGVDENHSRCSFCACALATSSIM